MKYEPVINDIGKTFGNLTIISIYYRADDKKKYAIAVCACTCGKSHETEHRGIRQGQVQSCGCLNKEKVGKINFKDMTGKKFHRLLVVSKGTKINKCGHRYWICRCDCGNIKEIDGASIRRGATTGCGECFLTQLSDKEKQQYLEDKQNHYHRQWSIKDKQWSKEIKIRDGHICQKCGATDDLESHHIYNHFDYPELRTNIDNGICLCKLCHFRFHNKYGKRYNNEKQLKEFLNDCNTLTNDIICGRKA